MTPPPATHCLAPPAACHDCHRRRLQKWRCQLAASAELRKWFGAKAEHFEEYKRRYFEELDAKPDAWRPLVEAAGGGKVGWGARC